MSGGIHILVGHGSNCTCGDCSVLYSGNPKDCYTTPYNNTLDRLEIRLRGNLKDGKIITKSELLECLEIMRAPICKLLKIKPKDYDRVYYGFMPLAILLANGYVESETRTRHDKNDIRRMHKRARLYVLWDIEKAIKAAAEEALKEKELDEENHV